MTKSLKTITMLCKYTVFCLGGNMSISSKFTDFMDWAVLEKPLLGFPVLFVMSGAALGLVLSPVFYIAHQNAQAYDNAIEQIDSNASVAFNSVAQCAERFNQQDCQQSHDQAMEIAKELGTSVKYSNKAECEQNHTTCEKHSYTTYIHNRVGNITTTTPVHHTDFFPAASGWQAMVNDLTVAVPLYQSNEAGIAVRKDGHKIEMQQSASAQNTQISYSGFNGPTNKGPRV